MNQKGDDVRSSGKDNVDPDNTILAPLTPKESDGKPQALREKQSSDIAIIGISGRFAGSPNLEAFWSHLQAGESCIEPIRRADWQRGAWPISYPHFCMKRYQQMRMVLSKMVSE